MSGKNDNNLGNKIVFSENLKYYLSLTGQLQKDIAAVAKGYRSGSKGQPGNDYGLDPNEIIPKDG